MKTNQMRTWGISMVAAAAGLVPAMATPTGDDCIIHFPFYQLDDTPSANDFLPLGASGVDWFEKNNDIVSSDVIGTFGGSLTYMSGGVKATADAAFFPADGSGRQAASVVQDHVNNWTDTKGAGLGVYQNKYEDGDSLDTGDDNVTAGEVLRITFDRVVNLKMIGLRAEGHDVTWDHSPATFFLNGVETLLPEGTGTLDVDMVGQEFVFKYGGARAKPDQFYLAGMGIKCVPDGGATVALFGLSMLGLGALRRKLR